MDAHRFDNLARTLASTPSRRQMRRRLLGGVAALAASPGRLPAASCRGAGQLCNQNANCCTGFCDTVNPDQAQPLRLPGGPRELPGRVQETDHRLAERH